MSTENTSGIRTFTATAVAIAAHVRVKLDSNGLISVAGAADAAVGVTIEAIAASGVGSVKLFNASGTFLMTAGGAINAGVHVYPAAAGKILSTGTTRIPLVTVEASTADGDVIEVAPALLGA